MSCLDVCAGALDSLRSVSFRFRPKNNDLIGSAFVIAESFENLSISERQSILDMVDSDLSTKLLGLSGFLAEAAVNANDESIVRVATVLHVVEDYRIDSRENIQFLILIAYASKRVGADFKFIVSSLDRISSERSRRFLNDFLLRDDSLNRLESFGLKEEVVDGVFRFSPLAN